MYPASSFGAAKTAGRGKHTGHSRGIGLIPSTHHPWFEDQASGSVGDVEGQLPDDAHSGLKSSFNVLGTLAQMKLDPMLHFRKEFQSKLHKAIIPNYSKHGHVHTDFLKLHLSWCFCNLHSSSVACLNFLTLTSFLFIYILEQYLGKKMSSKIFFLNLKASSLTFFTRISHF